MSAPRCDHNSADPRMCPDCRHERLTGRPAPKLGDLADVLADAMAPDRQIGPGEVDYLRLMTADMRHILDIIGWAGLPKDDLRALIHSAVYGVPPHTDVIIRASEALSDEPRLHVISTNAMPPRAEGSDHEREETQHPMKNLPSG